MSDRPGGVLRSRPRRQAAVAGRPARRGRAAQRAAPRPPPTRPTAARRSTSRPPAVGRASRPRRSPRRRWPATSAGAGVAVDKVVKLTAAGRHLRVGRPSRPAGKELAGRPLRRQDHAGPPRSASSRAPATASPRPRSTPTGVKATKTLVVPHRRRCPWTSRPTPASCPLAGETVGVGMPVIVHFDVPVTDKAVDREAPHGDQHLGQKGAWHWISDNEVHWRPVTYWKPGTDVTVNADVNSIPAGNGIYGQLSRTSTFHVGDAVISKVNAQTHQMKTFINGKLRQDHADHHRQARVHHPLRRQGDHREVPAQADELRDRRHQPQQPGRLRHRRRRVRHAGHLQRRVPARRPVVGRLAGLRQRQPRLHRHEHRERRAGSTTSASAATSSSTPAPTGR